MDVEPSRLWIEERVCGVAGAGAVDVIHTLRQRRRRARRDVDERLGERSECRRPLLPIDLGARFDSAVEREERGRRIEAGETAVERKRERSATRQEIHFRIVEELADTRQRDVLGHDIA